MSVEIEFEREWAMPSGRTFSIKPIRRLVESLCAEAKGKDGIIVDPFACDCEYGDVRNDLNPEYGTEYCMDALAFLRTIPDCSVELVLYDPPYSITQAAQLYKSYGKEKLEINVANMAYWARCKDEVARILKPGGKVLICGWSTNGCGKGRGFEMERILMVPHGGSKNDTLVTVERKL